MIIKMNVQILCEDLDQLLKDICDFLNNQVNNDNLTESQRLFANRLVQRSKKQLTQISQVSMALSADVDDSSYVDMNKQSVPPEEAVYEEGENNEYTPIVCVDTPKVVCPYELLPAIEIEKCEKFGHLDRKSRFLFIGHQKRLFAGVKDHWLLLYGTRKDPKPLDNLNLSTVVAKPLEGIKMRTFELTCKTSLKRFQFVAQTPKDMAQWIACINKRSSSTEQTNDITDSADDKDEEENLYEPLKINDDPEDTLKKKAKPLPPLPTTLENTYVFRNPKSELPTPEMESYDPVITRELPNIEEVHNNVEQEEIYDMIENVIKESPKETQIIRKPLPATPPAHPKLAEIQQQSSRTNSFSEDDEEEPIYDTLEQPLSPQSTTRSKRPPDPEPEEEYCDLRSDESTHVSEPEEEYCNLVTIQSSLRRKINKQSAFTPQEAEELDEEYDNITSIGTLTKSPVNVSNSQTKKQEVEEPTEEYLVPSFQFTEKKVSLSPSKQFEDPEPEEQYDNIASIRASVEKPATLPKSPMRQIRSPKPITNNKQHIEKPGDEYLLPLQRSPLKQAEESEPEEQYNNITSIRPNLPKLPMRNEEIKEPDDEYLLPNSPVTDKKASLPRPPLKPKPNIYKPKVEMKVENEDEECVYDCVISHPNPSTTTNTRTNTTNKLGFNIGIGFFNTQGNKSKKEAPIPTPKLKRSQKH